MFRIWVGQMIYYNSRHAFTLVECVVTMLLIAIIAVSLVNVSAYMTGLVSCQQRERIAYNLAVAQLEDLKDRAQTGYDNNYNRIPANDPTGALADGNNMNTTLTDIPYGFGVRYDLGDAATGSFRYKTVTTKCTGAANRTVKGFLVGKNFLGIK